MTESGPGRAARLSFGCRTEADTRALGAALAQKILPLLAARRSAFVVALSGPLGAGKTTLVRGLLAQLGVVAAVRSPTYALMECYDTPRCRAVHVDLYRLGAAEEVDSLGLRDLDQAGALWLIEWPERAARGLPSADLGLQLTIDADQHKIDLVPGSSDGRRALEDLRTWS